MAETSNQRVFTCHPGAEFKLGQTHSSSGHRLLKTPGPSFTGYKLTLLLPFPRSVNHRSLQLLFFNSILQHLFKLGYSFFVPGLQSGSVGKEFAWNADLGSLPGLGRSPGEGNGNPLQYSCLENTMDRGAWGASRPWDLRVEHNWEPNTFTFFVPIAFTALIPLSLTPPTQLSPSPAWVFQLPIWPTEIYPPQKYLNGLYQRQT